MRENDAPAGARSSGARIATDEPGDIPGPGKALRWFVLAAILLIATGLRLWRLTAPGLGLDETSIFVKVTMPTWPAFLEGLEWGAGGTPLYPTCSRIVFLATGKTELAMRLPALLAGVAAVWLIYLVGRAAFSTTTGLAAAFLLAVSPFHLYYSQEGRFYSFLATFSLLFIAAFFRAVRRDRPGDWIALTLAVAVGFYAHYYTALSEAAVGIFLGIAVVIAAVRRQRLFERTGPLNSLLKLVLCGLGALVLFSPWLVTNLAGEHHWYWKFDHGPGLVPAIFTDLAGWSAPFAAFLALLLGLAAVRTVARKSRHAAVLWSVILIGWGAVVALAWHFSYRISAMYFIFTLPVMLLLAAWALEWLCVALARRFRAGNVPRRAAVTVCCVCVCIGLLLSPAIAGAYRKRAETTRHYDMMKYIWEHAGPDDDVIYGPFAFLWGLKTNPMTVEKDIRVMRMDQAWERADEIAGNEGSTVYWITQTPLPDCPGCPVANFTGLYVYAQPAGPLDATGLRARIVRYLQAWPSSDGSRFRIYATQARVAALAGELERALFFWRKGFDDSNGYTGYSSAAMLCITAGDNARAEGFLRKETAVRPGNGRAHHQLGKLLRASGREAEAIASFEKAVECMPERADILGVLGGLYMTAGRLREAREAFRRATLLDPSAEWLSVKLKQARSLLARRERRRRAAGGRDTPGEDAQ